MKWWMTTLMVIYEFYLLIFKMSNGSSYGETCKRLLTPHVRSIHRKKNFISSSHSLSLILSFFHSFNTSLLWFFLPFIYTIKVIYSRLYFYLSHIYSRFTTKWYFLFFIQLTFTCVDLLLVRYRIVDFGTIKWPDKENGLKIGVPWNTYLRLLYNL